MRFNNFLPTDSAEDPFFLTKFGILKPIRCLMDGIAEFGKGKLDSRIELKTGDEIEELANSFNHMAEDIRSLFQH